MFANVSAFTDQEGKQCLCATTEDLRYVCGSDGVSYPNIASLNCENKCKRSSKCLLLNLFSLPSLSMYTVVELVALTKKFRYFQTSSSNTRANAEESAPHLTRHSDGNTSPIELAKPLYVLNKIKLYWSSKCNGTHFTSWTRKASLRGNDFYCILEPRTAIDSFRIHAWS